VNIFQFTRGKYGLYWPYPPFATDFGTATDPTTGLITFGLAPGAKQLWCDPSGNDANTGDSPSAAKATIMAAVIQHQQPAWFTFGSRIMVAGTAGRLYTDDGSLPNNGWTQDRISGLSKQYPVLIQSYDPADPFNQSKWGRLTGANMPTLVWTGGGVPMYSIYGDSGNNYLGFNGIEFDSQASTAAGFVFNGPHHGFIIQHCRFKNYMTTISSNRDKPSQDGLISLCTFYGGFANSTNMSGTFIAGQNNMRQQGCAYIHNGWEPGQTRDLGHAGIFGHGSYSHSDPTMPYLYSDMIYMDPASDGPNMRGNSQLARIVEIDSPIPAVFGGVSLSTMAEQPLGSFAECFDFVGMGCAQITTGAWRGSVNLQNLRKGSRMFNAAFFDKSPFSVGTERLAGCNNDGPPAIESWFEFQQVRAYNWFDEQLCLTGGSTPANAHVSATNCKFDIAVSGSGNTTWSGAPPGYRTKNQIIAALGIGDGSKNALARFLVEYPHMNAQIARALVTLGLQNLGLQPVTFAATAPPDTSGFTSPRALVGY
jgi:hypothetical protein